MNNVVLSGRIATDLELKQTQAGIPYLNFNLAVTRNRTKDGERLTDFIPVSCWRTTAEFVDRFFTKGKEIAVIGSIQVSDYQDKDGNKRKDFKVVADNVEFVGAKKDAEKQDTPYSNEEDLPF